MNAKRGNVTYRNRNVHVEEYCVQNSAELTSVLTCHQVCLGEELEGESGYLNVQTRILLE
jgi:hypothetical protein